MDVHTQLSHLSPEARAALMRQIKSRLVDSSDVQTDHDLAIIGGGVAALTFALEFRHARPTCELSSSSRTSTRCLRSPTRSGSRQSRSPPSTCATASDWPTT